MQKAIKNAVSPETAASNKTSAPIIPRSQLAQYGKPLHDLGYAVIPIKKGYKFPKGIKDWQTLKATPKAISSWQRRGFTGVGILADRTPAVDLDIYDADIARELIDFTLELVGETCVRIGQAPKALLPYRTDAPFKKMVSRAYIAPDGSSNRVEILGEGQQFVAYHVHPDTGKPYHYEGKELVDIARADLPVLSVAQAQQIIDHFESLARGVDGWRELKATKTANGKIDVAAAEFNIVTAGDYHDSLIAVTMDKVKLGWKAGEIVHYARGLMSRALENNPAQKMSRWQSRFDDIPRIVKKPVRERDANDAKVVAMFDIAPVADSLDVALAALAKADKDTPWAKIIHQAGLSAVGVEQCLDLLVTVGIGGKRALTADLKAFKGKVGGQKKRPALVDPAKLKSLPFDNHIRNLEKLFKHIKWSLGGEEIIEVLQTEYNYAALIAAYGIKLAWNELKHEPICDLNGTLETDGNLVINKVKSLATMNLMRTGEAAGNIYALARLNSYNPVIQYLESCKPRKGAIRELSDCVQVGNQKLFRRTLMRWMVQGVAAGSRGEGTPNAAAIARYEYLLALVGAQGLNKTKFFRALFAGVEGGFKDGFHLDPTDKDNVMQVTKFWGVELGEIDTTFTRSGISELKAFQSNTHDTYRQPYAKVDITVPRGTVFCGSANEDGILRDLTGGRRNHVFAATSITLPSQGLVDAAWGEARDLYLAGEQWWPTAEEEIAHNKHRGNFEVLSQEVLQMLAYFGEDFSKGEEWLSAREIILRSDPQTRLSNAMSRNINLYLKKSGCKMKMHARQSQWLMPNPLF